MPAEQQIIPTPTGYPRGPATVRHRKNAAEWLMYAALLPAFWIVRLAIRIRRVSGLFRTGG